MHIRRWLSGLVITGAVLTAAAWAVSPEMADNWAFARSGTSESLLDARILLWLLRIGAPATVAACWLALRRLSETQATLHTLVHELATATRLSDSDATASRVRRAVVRSVIVVWLILAGVHWADAARRVVHEWPIYRFRSGAQVLPNMSESNRDVIRYLRSATPEDARILVASDQTLFFLSYELWPRQVFQRRHPDSEFTVPQPDQARQLAAYRLSDLTSEDIAAIRPDFVLEYFEGPEYVEPDRVLDDPHWIAFVRQLHGDRAYIPPYNVRLRPITDSGSRP